MDEEDTVEYVIPVGYRFCPTEEELITYYLSNKSNGDHLPEIENNKILERRLYGKDATPWNVLKEDEPTWVDSGKKKFLYVFCKLTTVAKNGNRISRVAGCGTWEGKAAAQEIRIGGRVIGQKRQFSFKPKKNFEKEAEGKGHWIMHEYSLPEEAAGGGGRNNCKNDENYVICKITNEISKGFEFFHQDSSSTCRRDEVITNGRKRKSLDVEKKKKKQRRDGNEEEIVKEGYFDDVSDHNHNQNQESVVIVDHPVSYLSDGSSESDMGLRVPVVVEDQQPVNFPAVFPMQNLENQISSDVVDYYPVMMNDFYLEQDDLSRQMMNYSSLMGGSSNSSLDFVEGLMDVQEIISLISNQDHDDHLQQVINPVIQSSTTSSMENANGQQGFSSIIIK